MLFHVWHCTIYLSFSGERSSVAKLPGFTNQRRQGQEHPHPRPHSHNHLLLLRFWQTICPCQPQSYHSFYQTKPAFQPQPRSPPPQGLMCNLINSEKRCSFTILFERVTLFFFIELFCAWVSSGYSNGILNRSWPLSSRSGFGSWCYNQFSLTTLPLATSGLSGTILGEKQTGVCSPFY